MISVVLVSAIILFTEVGISGACIEMCSCQEASVVYCGDLELSDYSLPSVADRLVEQVVLSGNNLAVVNLSALLSVYPSLQSIDLRDNLFLRCGSLQSLPVIVFTDNCGYRSLEVEKDLINLSLAQPSTMSYHASVNETVLDLLTTPVTFTSTDFVDSELTVAVIESTGMIKPGDNVHSPKTSLRMKMTVTSTYSILYTWRSALLLPDGGFMRW